MSETRQTGPALDERIAATGLRVTRQRVRVLEELAREPHDLTAQDDPGPEDPGRDREEQRLDEPALDERVVERLEH